jgi:hypothetical protein
MAARLGQVLSWTANIIALAILALFGFMWFNGDLNLVGLLLGVVIAATQLLAAKATVILND